VKASIRSKRSGEIDCRAHTIVTAVCAAYAAE
jgi:hypothetical protein